MAPDEQTRAQLIAEHDHIKTTLEIRIQELTIKLDRAMEEIKWLVRDENNDDEL